MLIQYHSYTKQVSLYTWKVFVVIVVLNNAEAKDMPKTGMNSPHSSYFISATDKIVRCNIAFFSCAHNASEADENTHESKLLDYSTLLNLLKHDVCLY